MSEDSTSRRTRPRPPSTSIAAVLISAVLVTGCLHAYQVRVSETTDSASLPDLGLERLMSLEVTTVARRAQPLTDAPAAVYVLTRQDLLRYGVRSIPEALRLIPGVEVAQLDASKWSVTIRGFSSRFNGYLLVLIDGRSVYNPVFGGVEWDQHDLLFEDVDRIEVVRGPGATIWGTNATQGVINIVTRPARATTGTFSEVAAGSHEQLGVGVRHGGKLGSNGFYRLWAKGSDQAARVREDGSEAADDLTSGRAGVRLEWDLPAESRLMVEGQVAGADYGETLATPLFAPPYEARTDSEGRYRGGYTLARWKRSLKEGSAIQLQASWSTWGRRSRFVDADHDQVELGLQHDFVHHRHHVVWGAGYRHGSDQHASQGIVEIAPLSDDYGWLYAYIQDRIDLVPERWRLFLGSTVEHNDFSGWEVQPSVRLQHVWNDRTSLWASLTRAVSTPNRSQLDSQSDVAVFPDPQTGLPVLVRFATDADEAESVNSLEVGFRRQLSPSLFLDVTAFRNRVDDYVAGRSDEPSFEPTPVPHVVLPFVLHNSTTGSVRGAEVALHWSGRRWKLDSSYTALEMDLEIPEDPLGAFFAEVTEQRSPENQLKANLQLELPRGLDLGVNASWRDELPLFALEDELRLDVTLSVPLSERLQLQLRGANLVSDDVPEYGRELAEVVTGTPRSFLVALRSHR